MKMYAMVTDQGTAMPETALCEEHLEDTHARSMAQGNGVSAEDIGEDVSFHDCSGNELLECLQCGSSIFGPYAEESSI